MTSAMLFTHTTLYTDGSWKGQIDSRMLPTTENGITYDKRNVGELIEHWNLMGSRPNVFGIRHLYLLVGITEVADKQ